MDNVFACSSPHVDRVRFALRTGHTMECLTALPNIKFETLFNKVRAELISEKAAVIMRTNNLSSYSYYALVAKYVPGFLKCKAAKEESLHRLLSFGRRVWTRTCPAFGKHPIRREEVVGREMS